MPAPSRSLGALDPQIEWHVWETLPWGGTYYGHAEVEQLFNKLFEHVEEIRPEPDEILDAGDRVLSLAHLRGRAKSGSEFEEVPIALVWTMRQGGSTRTEGQAPLA